MKANVMKNTIIMCPKIRDALHPAARYYSFDYHIKYVQFPFTNEAKKHTQLKHTV